MIGKIFSNIVARFKSASAPIEDIEILEVEVEPGIYNKKEMVSAPDFMNPIRNWELIDQCNRRIKRIEKLEQLKRNREFEKFRIRAYAKTKGIKFITHKGKLHVLLPYNQFRSFENKREAYEWLQKYQ